LCATSVDRGSVVVPLRGWGRSRTLALATSAGLSLLLLTACGTSGSTTGPTAEPGSTAVDNELDAVACPTSTHCVAVGGSHSYGPNAYRTLIEESTGGAWAIVPSPSSASGLGSTLYDVTCPSPNLCIAVGKNEDFASTPTTLIEQNTGGGWRVVPSPNPTSYGAPYGVLNSVTCVSPVDCIAVGVYLSDKALSQPLIEENRGSGWVIVPSPGTGTGDVLNDVACTGAGTCYAVGSAGEQTGDLIMQRTNDGVWAIDYHTIAPPCPSGTTCIRVGYLDDVTCSSAGTCIANPGFLEYAAGEWSVRGTGSAGGTLPSRVTCDLLDCVGATSLPNGGILIEEETSGVWSTLAALAAPEPGWLHPLVPNDIACAHGAHCVVVGWISAESTGPKRTLIAEGTGSQWAIVSSPNVTGDFASRARTAAA
jgi:hypothetical protein